MDKGEEFLKQLDELILLFGKLREKATREGVVQSDDPMYKNFELLAGNYHLIRNNIPGELISELGGPIKQMITEMVNQLKKELGVEDFQIEPDRNNESSARDIIDKKLQGTNLTEQEINSLLDKRAQLNNN